MKQLEAEQRDPVFEYLQLQSGQEAVEGIESATLIDEVSPFVEMGAKTCRQFVKAAAGKVKRRKSSAATGC